MTLSLGIIADDFTGATDIAGFMVQSGWRVVQLTKLPDENTPIPTDIDAIVISLKSRSCPVEEAVESSIKACRWLRQDAGCQQIFFKYCSTFDSTPTGNIGPVIDALMEELATEMTLLCPALPINGRTVIHGHLFVNGVLLNQSGMENHPLTPMTESNLLQLMERQAQGKAGLVSLSQVQQGSDAIQERLQQLRQQKVRYAVMDILTMQDLLPVAEAAHAFPLLTGGSGLGAALACQATSSPITPKTIYGEIPPKTGRRTVVLSGSCSTMTNQQVEYYRTLAPHQQLDVKRCLYDDRYVAELTSWILENSQQQWAPMIYATQPADVLQQIQQKFGAAAASAAVEKTFALIVQQLQQHGINTFIVAGGETAGTIVQSLGVNLFSIGAPIAPGVPWVQDLQQKYYLALKSGNFGTPPFFQRAQEMFYD